MRPASSRSWYRSSTSRAIAVPDASPRPDNSASHNSSSPDAVCFASDEPARRSRVRPRSDIDVRRSEKNALFMIVPSRPARCRGKLVYRIGRQFAPIIARIKELQQECFGLVARMRIVGDLRLWPRLLPRTTLIDGEVCSRVREPFDVTPPRFDLMARLDKAPDGMTLSDVSKQMMISNGNVTGLVERLVESGHLDRRTLETDRRVQVIRLTKIGRAEFRKMAAEHETWIADIFSELGPKDVRELMRLLAKTKASAQKSAQKRAL